MKVHVFSDPTLRVGFSNPDPSNICANHILLKLWNEHGFDEKLYLAAREVHWIGTYTLVLSLLTSRSMLRLN